MLVSEGVGSDVFSGRGEVLLVDDAEFCVEGLESPIFGLRGSRGGAFVEGDAAAQ
jgi:hypothetical protein